MIDCSQTSSSGIARSSAIARCSFGLLLLISAVTRRASGSRSTASNAGRTNGSIRRSTRTRSVDKSASRLSSADPVLAGGRGRLVFESTALLAGTSECLQQFDQRPLVGIRQRGAERVAPVDNQIGALAHGQ